MKKRAHADTGSPADEAARLLQQAAALVAAGKLDQAADAQRHAAKLLARAQAARTTTDGRIAPQQPPLERAQPSRQVVIDALNDLGVPASPRAIADYVTARFDVHLDYRLFASLRRDERRAWKSPRSHRPVYLVPALNALAPRRVLAMRGKLALSDWPLALRLVGPWSERVDHLQATINLARQVIWLSGRKPAEATRVSGLLARYAATVPDAIDRNGQPDPARVERAADAELAVLRERDSAWREDMAGQVRAVLSDEEQLWGVAEPWPSALEAVG